MHRELRFHVQLRFLGEVWQAQPLMKAPWPTGPRNGAEPPCSRLFLRPARLSCALLTHLAAAGLGAAQSEARAVIRIQGGRCAIFSGAPKSFRHFFSKSVVLSSG